MRILLHTCCAPCSIKCIDALRSINMEPVLFWYNPNIHPFAEYRNRKDTLIEYAKIANAELLLQDTYGLRPFITNVYPDFDKRCGYCYRTRLEAVAEYASQNHYESFSTTLLISPYQNHELICLFARQAAEKYHVEFIYQDFRPFFREGQQAARNLGLYMQKYCGCIFSEEERYKK